MTKGYTDILNEMLDEYESVAGQRPDSASPEHKRFEAVASELFSLSCLIERMSLQAFVQSAQGEYLDRHAELHGLERKKACHALGSLTFTLNEAALEDTLIPAGTVCSVRNNPLLQYETQEDAVIPAGELSVSVGAKSVQAGYRYNVPQGFVSVMVNAPAGIGSVINNEPFSAGKDDESDGHLRARIMDFCGTVQNGINRKSFENAILGLDFVRDCFVAYSNYLGVVRVYLTTQNGELTQENINEIKAALPVCGTVGVEIDAALAIEYNYEIGVEISVRAGYDAEEARQKAEEVLRDVCTSLRIGRPLEFSAISNRLVRIEEIENFRIYSPGIRGGVISGLEGEYLYPRKMEVRVLE